MLPVIATATVRVVAPDQDPPRLKLTAAAAELFGLSERERDWVATMVRGRALWRLQRRGAVVHTVLTDAERQVCDTDRSMTA